MSKKAVKKEGSECGVKEPRTSNEPKTRVACRNCRTAKTCCGNVRPCPRCVRLNLESSCEDPPRPAATHWVDFTHHFDSPPIAPHKPLVSQGGQQQFHQEVFFCAPPPPPPPASQTAYHVEPPRPLTQLGPALPLQINDERDTIRASAFHSFPSNPSSSSATFMSPQVKPLLSGSGGGRKQRSRKTSLPTPTVPPISEAFRRDNNNNNNNSGGSGAIIARVKQEGQYEGPIGFSEQIPIHSNTSSQPLLTSPVSSRSPQSTFFHYLSSTSSGSSSPDEHLVSLNSPLGFDVTKHIGYPLTMFAPLYAVTETPPAWKDSWHKMCLTSPAASHPRSHWSMVNGELIEYNSHFFEQLDKPLQIEVLNRFVIFTCKRLFQPQHAAKCFSVMNYIVENMIPYIEVDEIWWLNGQFHPYKTRMMFVFEPSGRPIRLEMISTPLAPPLPDISHIDESHFFSPHSSDSVITDALPLFASEEALVSRPGDS